MADFGTLFSGGDCHSETEGTSDKQARESVGTVEDKRSITTNTLGVQDALAERLEQGDSVNSDNRLAIWTRCAGEGRLALRARLQERDEHRDVAAQRQAQGPMPQGGQ